MKPVSLVLLVLSLLAVVGLLLGPGAVWVLENVDGVTQDDGVAPAITSSPTRPSATPPATATTPPANPKELTAKDWASAVAAVRGNMLAIATGLAALLVVIYTARNANTARSTFQLGERGHVTDRYGKAVEQLGSDQAPVRLGGLYALDQLGQDNPSAALRQTIVDVICAYLRMPYTPPAAETGPAEPAVPRATIGGVSARPGRDSREERQVRLTAQRILSAHLRYQDPPTRRWWQPRGADLNARHWADLRLDLTGATLLDFDLDHCRVGDALFVKATFTGDARFNGATFTGKALFENATFTGDAGFINARFIGGHSYFDSGAEFAEVTFTGIAWFEGAIFTPDAKFERTTFTSNARFRGATFTSNAWFQGTTFTRDAGFEDVTFEGFAMFVEVTFTGNARFDKATFGRDATFGELDRTTSPRFGATFASDARFVEVTFYGNAAFDKATFTGNARFDRATFTHDAEFGGATGLEQAGYDGVRLAPPRAEYVAPAPRVGPPCGREEPGADGWRTLRLARPEEGGGEGGEAAESGPAGEAGG